MKFDEKVCILGIESSCDDTAAAIWRNGRIRSNVRSVQIAHRDYGGVVPELASRKHMDFIYPVVRQALKDADIDTGSIDGIAFTKGPGLLGSLMVGTSFAKSLSLAWDKPLLGVHHMRAHVLSHLIDPPHPAFPFLCLTVSGGHTQIIRVDEPMKMTVLGETRDDAAGEAFDKAGKMMGLHYPSGPEIDRLAEQCRPVYEFPKPQLEELDFSFSGLKTAFLYFLQDRKKEQADFIERERNNLCASIRQTIVEILIEKLERAIQQTDIHEVAIAGGVSANTLLRSELTELGERLGCNTYIPDFQYCTDNAAMIAMAGYFKYRAKEFDSLETAPSARLPFSP